MQIGFLLKTLVLLLAVLWVQSVPGVAGTIVRTLAYHQITGPNDLFGSSPYSPILSANGNKAAFALPPSGTGDPQRPNRIFVINSDGTGFQQVDSYTTLCFCGSFVDISADGAKVVSTDAVQIRAANGDGSGATPLIALDSNEINELAISGDGSKVFFRVYRDTAIRGSNPVVPIPNGIYVINSSGTGLRQIVGKSQLAALLGRPESDFNFFGSNTPFSTLRSSHDGSKLVFSSMVAPQSGGFGQRLFGVNLDGGGLHDFFGQMDWAFQSTISSDGTKVGYTVRMQGDNKDETGTINFDGTGKVKLFDSTQGLQFYLSRHQLSGNGSQLFIADAGVLFNTSNGERIALAGRPSDGTPLVWDGLIAGTMNSAANKFLYLFLPPNQPYQLARLDLNPASLGASPTLTQPNINPPIIPINKTGTSGDSTTVTVRTTDPVNLIGVCGLYQGLPDFPIQTLGTSLVDDGQLGDVTAGDNLFTNNLLFATGDAVPGPRLLRLKGEITAANGFHHATAIDYDGFQVVQDLPGLSINDVSLVEGDANTVNATFTVRLSAIPQVPVTVQFQQSNGTAVDGVDYILTNGTVTFNAGETSKTLSVPIKGDVLDEDNETFFVNLSNPSGARIIDGQGLGTIRDNDNPPNFSIGDITITEGTGGTKLAVFPVTLSAPSGRATGITCVTANGTARSPGDYVPNRVNLSFNAGEISQTFSVEVNGDSLDEDAENFFALLTLPINAGVARGRGIGTINDNDLPPSITIEDVNIGEGNGGQRTAVFRLHLSAPSGKLVKVNYATAVGTATAGTDYNAVTSTQIAFTTGQTITLARVLINGDLLNEPNETFKVNLSSALNATIADSQALGTILNDDTAPSLSINDVSVTEGNSGTKNLTFTVSLSAPSGQSVSVNFATANGVARSTSDYVAKTGTLTFAAGQTSKTISVVVNGDTTIENDETLFVLLSGATNASIGKARGTGTITNDDGSG